MLWRFGFEALHLSLSQRGINALLHVPLDLFL